MLGNGFEMILIFHRILDSLVLGWAPNHFVLGAQLALGEKRLACIAEEPYFTFSVCKGESHLHRSRPTWTSGVLILQPGKHQVSISF